MKTKLLALLLLVAILTTMLASCEVLEFVNHMLNIFGPGDDSDTNIDLDINIGGTTAHVHTEGVLPATESTCTTHGLTEGRYCTTCEKVLVPQEEAPLKAHTFDDDRDATCNDCSFVRDITCYHTHIEFLEAKDSTCTETGLTEGRKCEDCGLILVAQEVVELKNHTAGDWIIDKPASTTEEGHKYLTCVVCKQVIEESLIPIIKNPSKGLAFTLNSDNKSYSVSGIGTCTDTYIVIPDSYNNLPVTGIGVNAFRDCESITNVEIPDSIISISYGAFSMCTSLTNITIPDTVTTMGNDVFYGCTSLENVTLGNSISSIGENAFCGCSSIKNIEIPDSVTSINSAAFRDCTSLNAIIISDNVAKIDAYAFYNCASLKSVKIGNSVTSIGQYAFYQCSLLSDLVIGNSVKTIGNSAFAFCSSLKNLTLPNTVTTIGNSAFFKCTSLTTAILGNSVQTIDICAFYSCTSLSTVTIPQTVTSIGRSAFVGCTSITIYCEAESQPTDWNSSWKDADTTVTWGYTGN